MEQIAAAAQQALRLTLRALEQQEEQIDIRSLKELVSILKTLSELTGGGEEESQTGVVLLPPVEDG